MSWSKKTLFVGLVLLVVSLFVGFGFDGDGKQEVGFARAMTTIAGYMSFLALFLFPVSGFLFLAERMPSIGKFWDKPLPWVLVLLGYGIWLVFSVLFLLLASTGRNGWDDGDCGTLRGWASEHSRPAYRLQRERIDWPPLSQRCIVDNPYGHFEKVFPTEGQWITFFVFAGGPALLWPLARRMTAGDRRLART
ncbi:MAG TPA: hypothetical protein VG518_09365 [Solirubrobacterales bacterium]|nr:hypothetical protein [Solirubrobacterales bacterium]